MCNDSNLLKADDTGATMSPQLRNNVMLYKPKTVGNESDDELMS